MGDLDAPLNVKCEGEGRVCTLDVLAFFCFLMTFKANKKHWHSFFA